MIRTGKYEMTSTLLTTYVGIAVTLCEVRIFIAQMVISYIMVVHCGVGISRGSP